MNRKPRPSPTSDPAAIAATVTGGIGFVPPAMPPVLALVLALAALVVTVALLVSTGAGPMPAREGLLRHDGPASSSFFTAGDDPGMSEGWFEDPRAALAFGCAMDEEIGSECGRTEDTARLLALPTAESEAVPEASTSGRRCRPIGIALGAPAFEPDRCEWAG
jgi:hypothetical protein